MKTKFGAIVVDGRGKIGGHVMSKNRNGSYMRTKVTPVNGQTPSQTGVRSLFTQLSQAWRGLTQEQRDAWNAAVSDYSRTNIFGDLVNPSGFNLFQRLNNNLISIDGVQMDEPPLPAAVESVTALSLTYTVGTPALAVVMSAAVPLTSKIKVFATAPQSAGKSFVKSEYRHIKDLSSLAATPASIATEYIAKFGSLGAVGQKIFVKLLAINTETGQAGTPSSVSAISAA